MGMTAATVPAVRVRQRLPVVGGVLFAVGFGLAVWGLAAYASVGWPGGAWSVSADFATLATWLVSGVITATARPRSPFGWLLLGGGLCLAVGGALSGQAAADAASGRLQDAAWLGWVGNWIFFPHLAAAAVIYLVFPDGLFPDARIRESRWRIWAAVAVVADLLGMVLLALTPGRLATSGPLTRVDNPIGGTALAADAFPVAVVGLNIAFIAGLVAVWRRRQGSPATMRQLLTLVFVLAVVNLGVGLLVINPPGDWVYTVTVPVTVGLTGTICAGIMWGDLWDVRRTVGRVLVFLILSAFIVGAFVAIVAVAQALIGNQLIGVAVAGLLVCLAFAPVQAWLRARMERALYGRRRDPYGVLSEFGAVLESAGEPADGLQRLVEMVASDLRLPGVTIELGALSGAPAASTGVADAGGGERFPIRYQGDPVGALVVAHRSGEAHLAAADRRLLRDLARQAGAAAHGLALTATLRRHRAELVAVREGERRRLRRDLHDGMASGLTAVGLTAEVAEDALPNDPLRSARALGQVRAGVATLLADLRRVIDGLGPSMLADLGLRDAVAVAASQLSTGTPAITVDIAEDLPDVSSAIEEATFWIITEALHNVIRHAQAEHCRVSITSEITSDSARLRVVVDDDGTGLPERPRDGVGLDSIRLRAEHAGGHATIDAHSPRGTRVVADFPLTDVIGKGAVG
jgi:two-component system NarL family sensor kinase